MFCKFWGHVIKCFGATITKKPHLCPKINIYASSYTNVVIRNQGRECHIYRIRLSLDGIKPALLI